MGLSKIFRAAAVACAAALLSEPAAAASYWDLSQNELKLAVPEVHEITAAGASSTVLRAEHVDLAGLTWRRVDFVYGPSRQLQRIVMQSETADFDTLKERILDGYSAIAPTLQHADYEGPSDDDGVMICENDQSQISLTYARPASAGSAIQIALKPTAGERAGG